MKRADRLKQRQDNALAVLEQKHTAETVLFLQRQDAWNAFMVNRKSLPVSTQEAAEELVVIRQRLDKLEAEILAIRAKRGYNQISRVAPLNATRYSIHDYLKDAASFGSTD